MAHVLLKAPSEAIDHLLGVVAGPVEPAVDDAVETGPERVEESRYEESGPGHRQLVTARQL